MATDDQLNSTRPISRKYRVVTHNETTGNNRLSRLPSLLSKSSVCLSSSETPNYKRYRPHQKDILNTSSSKIERQTTHMNSQTRLPPLNTTSNDNNSKERYEYQRRQIYALNHLMRELEQEQFREFCKSNGIGTENSVEIISNDEDPNKQSTTST